jgi:hypothetical protein
MSVNNVIIDIVDYVGTKDFQVYTEYLTEHDYDIVVRRLDGHDGWAELLEVLVVYTTDNNTQRVLIGASKESYRRIRITTHHNLEKGDHITPKQNYDPLPYVEPQRISRQKFNDLFETNIVELPKNMYAFGVKDGDVYLYNATFEHYYMIELLVRHLLGVLLGKRIYRTFHTLLCAYDGYLEGHYLSRRFAPQTIGESECKDVTMIKMEAENTYPVFYKEKWVIAQSNQQHVPYTVDMPDRYYFYLNRYNMYRSVHAGIPFEEKKAEIVFASQPRGTKHNFTRRRDIDMSQRAYFYSDAVSKTYVHAPKHIDRSEMVKYKYILDIDGNASTWDATAWKLNSGSVILKTDSAWRQWFYIDYKPWTHYIPVKDDFSDLQTRYDWCEAHPNECKAMVARCAQLFQKAYCYQNVIDYTVKQLVRIQGMPFYKTPSAYVYPFTSHASLLQGIQHACFTSGSQIHRLLAAEYMCTKLHDNDLVVFTNSDLTDISKLDMPQLVDRYMIFGKPIVFGAEKNLWPGSLERHRQTLIADAPESSPFKYLNSGFYMAQVGPLRKLLRQFVHTDSDNDQEYFTRAHLTGRYGTALDYDAKLVLNTYLCSKEDIESKKKEGTMFIHYNAGR